MNEKVTTAILIRTLREIRDHAWTLDEAVEMAQGGLAKAGILPEPMFHDVPVELINDVGNPQFEHIKKSLDLFNRLMGRLSDAPRSVCPCVGHSDDSGHWDPCADCLAEMEREG